MRLHLRSQLGLPCVSRRVSPPARTAVEDGRRHLVAYVGREGVGHKTLEGRRIDVGRLHRIQYDARREAVSGLERLNF